MKHSTVSGIVAAFLFAPLLAVATPAAAAVTQAEFKTFLETRDALEDERVQKMAEKQRIPAIAQRNFKMKASELQAILDKVEAEGGEKAIADQAKGAVEKVLAGTALASRVKEVKVDTSSPHVVTYVFWTVEDPARIDAEAALIALKAGTEAPITSTFRLIGKNPAGKDIYRANISPERTKRIRENRIDDWASTRYRNLFEVENIQDAAVVPAPAAAPAVPAAAPAAEAAPAP